MKPSPQNCSVPRMHVEVLGDAEIDAAFPLICATVPVEIERWRSFVRSRRTDGGILALTVEDSGPLGVLSWFTRSDLLHGSSFVIDNLIVFELRRSAPGEWTLLGAAEEIARRLHCGAIEVRCRVRGETEAWRAGGWSQAPPRFSKTIGPVAAASGAR